MQNPARGAIPRQSVKQSRGPRGFTVDAAGRRIKKVDGTLTRQWLYRDSLKPIAELDGNGAILALFGYGERYTTPSFVERDGKRYRVISDHLGSPRVVVRDSDSNERPVVAEYSAFGEVTGSGLGWMPFGFAGGIYDPDTGLVRFGARDYDPVVGRWTSKDPILFDGGQENLYAYVGNDPVNAIDVLGLLEGVPDWLLDLEDRGILQDLGDFSAGVASALTFGLSDKLIGATGLDAYGSKCSTARHAGEIGGAVVGFAGGAGARAGVRISAGLYKNGGGGINVYRHGKRMAALDWHRFKLDGRLVNRPHLHVGKSRKQMDKHWPWQKKGGGGYRLPWD